MDGLRLREEERMFLVSGLGRCQPLQTARSGAGGVMDADVLRGRRNLDVQGGAEDAVFFVELVRGGLIVFVIVADFATVNGELTGIENKLHRRLTRHRLQAMGDVAGDLFLVEIDVETQVEVFGADLVGVSE